MTRFPWFPIGSHVVPGTVPQTWFPVPDPIGREPIPRVGMDIQECNGVGNYVETVKRR